MWQFGLKFIQFGTSLFGKVDIVFCRKYLYAISDMFCYVVLLALAILLSMFDWMNTYAVLLVQQRVIQLTYVRTCVSNGYACVSIWNATNDTVVLYCFNKYEMPKPKTTKFNDIMFWGHISKLLRRIHEKFSDWFWLLRKY